MEKKVNQGVLRKRGRPTGKNRVPLSQTERRARNAQYEKERREGMAESFADLAAAVGISGSIKNTELLATVISHLQQATQVKHSSDVETLKRCNRNLLAQIEKLEQQLAEPDQGYSAVPEGVILSRPFKRKLDDCDSHEVPVLVQLPKRSPEEDDYAPVSPCLTPDSAHPGLVDQQYFLGRSLSSAYLPEELDHSSQSSILQEHGSGTAPTFKQEFLPADPWLPAQNSLPVQVSPMGSILDQQEQDFDYSSYRFAGPQIPTPEYPIESTMETTEYIYPCIEEVYYQPPQPCHFEASPPDQKFPIPGGSHDSSSTNSDPSSPNEVYAPYHCNQESQRPFAYWPPVPSNVVGSVEIIPTPGCSSFPDDIKAEPDPGHDVLSSECMYF